MEMMGMDTGPFSQHEAIEGMRYRSGPPSGGPSHVPVSHNVANASDNHGSVFDFSLDVRFLVGYKWFKMLL